VKVIPIFIPHSGCPYRCVYCDQYKISGAAKALSAEEICSVIERDLKTIPRGERVEIAFFGGTFTLLPEETQKKYLDAVYPYMKNKKIAGVRMSTHPEAVSKDSMDLFKKKGGCLVELGIQSLDKDVLMKSGRSMKPKAVENAVKFIKDARLELGVQVMLGLPGDTLERSIKTAKALVRFKPRTARIYPTLVIKGTKLAWLYKKGKYKPLSMEDAVDWASRVSDIFEAAGVNVIRVGLHPSRDLNSKKSMLAGPYHASFGQMARSRQARNKIKRILGDKKIPNRSRIEIHAPKNMFNVISGHGKSEKIFLEKHYAVPIVFHNLLHLRGGRIARPQLVDMRKNIAVIDPRVPSKAKDRLKKMNFYIVEAPLHEKLSGPVQGHPDMMLFSYGKKVIYEPRLEDIAGLLRNNGYECVKGAEIKSSIYPKDIIYNACSLGDKVIRYEGRVERNIENLKGGFIKVRQGYVKCSVIPIDDKHIITSDKGIYDKCNAGAVIDRPLLVKPGYVRLPGHKTGFIGGTSGVFKNNVFFLGSLRCHPDGNAIRDFIKSAGKNVIELYDGPLYDAGTIYFFEASTSRSWLV